MAKRPITNCGDCAYVKEADGKLWCPFHDLPVHRKVVCDDFLNELDSPQWNSLLDGLGADNTSRKKVPQYTAFDIGSYILSACALGLVMMYTLIILFFK